MPKFKYKIRDKYGKRASGVIEGETRELVAKHLEEKGYIPVEITADRDVGSASVLGRFQFGKLKAVGLFTRQFATLTKSGLPLVRSLTTLERQVEQPFFKQALADVTRRVEGGEDLHTAMAQHPLIFNQLYVSMVSVGEASGTLDEVLAKLADLIEYEIETRAKMLTVLLYPAMAILAMIAGFTILSIVVLPKIVTIFKDLKGSLPLPTLILIKTNYIMQNYWYLIFGGAIAAGIAFVRYINTKPGRKVWDRIKLRIPFIGTIIFKLIMSRFARVTSILVRSGVPILNVLDLTSKSAGNVIIGEAIENIKEDVKEGKGMAEPMRKAKVFSPIVLQMVAIGEETGRLDELLYEVSGHYDREASYAVEYLATIIEPIIIVLIACGVLVMALGIFLPMWNAYTLIIQGGTTGVF